MGFFRILILFLLPFLICINNAFALRPFVTTDADVLKWGEIEFVYSFFGVKEEKTHGSEERTIELPNLNLNFGLLWDMEFDTQTTGEFIDEGRKGGLEFRKQQFSDTGAFLKKVWHWGNGVMPNIATETGILFPTERDREKIDFEGLLIFTWELEGITFHTTIGGATESKKRSKAFGDEDLEVEETRGVFIYGSILDYEVKGEKGLHLVSEYSLEKVEKQSIEHQVLGGVVWEGPWNMNF
ncbi:MAG: hypothetical protein ACE5H1_10365, partial [Thermodesulfobacteriota bacterium]